MTDKKKIRAEIERRQKELSDGCVGQRFAYQTLLSFIDSLQEEPVSKVWHDASEEPCDMGHCLIYFGAKGRIGYLDFDLVFYNKQEKSFITESYPHPTGYMVEQKSLDGACAAEVYRYKRDRISISDIAKWAYLKDIFNLTHPVTETGDQEELVSEDLKTEYHKFLKDRRRKGFYEVAEHFANWQKQQMMKDVFVFEYKHNIACCLASECLRDHGWFGRESDFNDLWKFISGVKELFEGEFKVGDKVIIIKQEE